MLVLKLKLPMSDVLSLSPQEETERLQRQNDVLETRLNQSPRQRASSRASSSGDSSEVSIHVQCAVNQSKPAENPNCALDSLANCLT